MSEDLKTALKENRIYKVFFDSTMHGSSDPDDDCYDEVIYYDGGGVEGWQPTEESKP